MFRTKKFTNEHKKEKDGEPRKVSQTNQLRPSVTEIYRVLLIRPTLLHCLEAFSEVGLKTLLISTDSEYLDPKPRRSYVVWYLGSVKLPQKPSNNPQNITKCHQITFQTFQKIPQHPFMDSTFPTASILPWLLWSSNTSKRRFSWAADPIALQRSAASQPGPLYLRTWLLEQPAR